MKTTEDELVAPLASWCDGAAKQSILAFVKRVTTEGQSRLRARAGAYRRL
ncbi:MAG TPA: hypothetical protein VMI10_08320 [Terriglobales bacterium]|nr:hypothetical protein [Terriglobales bacterium]